MQTSKLFRASLTLTVLGGIALYGPNANAQVFTDRALWLAAAGVVQTEDFESVSVGSIPAGTTPLGLVSLTIDRYSAVFDLPRIQDGGAVDGTRELVGYITNDDLTAGEPGFGPNFMTFSFSGPVNAWGADFSSTMTGAFLTVETAGVTYEFDNFLTAPGDGFFGIVSPVPFLTITLNKENPALGEEFRLDNLSFAVAGSSAAPEPGAHSLLVGALLPLIGVLARRRKR